MKKILIADDHELVINGLKNNFQFIAKMQVVATAVSGMELLSLLKSNYCDAVVLDLKMPDKDGWDTLYEIKRLYPTVKVLIYTIDNDFNNCLRAFQYGADGFCFKGEPMETLNYAMNSILNGHKHIPSEYSAKIIDALLNPENNEAPLSCLTNREHQVFRYIISGLNSNQIAERMNLSIKTISTYRTAILSKLNMKSEHDLIKFAQLNGMN